jgi:signal transduction histidine kinase
LTDRHRHLALLERAVAAIHDERRPDRALKTAVRLVAEHNGWRLGYVYRARSRPPVASPTGIWYDADADSDPELRRTVRALRRTTGVELASHVLQTQRPLWFDAVDPHDALTPLHAHGLHVLALFPVMTSRRPVAVLEFVAGEVVRPDEEFLLVMRVIGIQLGYLIERANLERRLARLQVQEQQRIARELHDTVGQEAAAIGMLTRMLHQDLERRAAAETDLAGRLLEEVQQVKLRIRDFVSDLRPIEVHPGELRAKLEEMAQRYARLGGCTCTVEVDDSITVGDAFAATKIARIAREAVHNAVKHGRPQHIAIALRRRGDDAVELEIVDDGSGADAQALAGGGLGQQIMRYRADLLSADLDIGSTPGRGVRVLCVIPDEALEPDDEEEADT